MVNIPVEKKGGMPGWAWVLIVLGVAGALALIIGLANRDNEVATTEPAAAPAGENEGEAGRLGAVRGGGTETIRDLNALTSAQNMSNLLGKQVDLSSVTVNRVLSDRVFTIGPAGKEIFAMLAPPLDRGGAEQRVVVNAGERLDLSGVLGSPPTEDAATLKLNEGDYNALKGQQAVLVVRQIREL